MGPPRSFVRDLESQEGLKLLLAHLHTSPARLELESQEGLKRLVPLDVVCKLKLTARISRKVETSTNWKPPGRHRGVQLESQEGLKLSA